MKKIYLFTNIAPHYRSSLWLCLLNNTSYCFDLFFGQNPVFGIPEIDFSQKQFAPFQHKLHQIKNNWIKGKILFWQNGVISKCLTGKLDVAIFLGEMYCLSTWIAAIICRLRGIEVVFWGHGIYGNEGILKLFLRKIFYRLANKHLLYERRAKRIMSKQGFNPDKLYVIFNSLDYKEHKILREQFQQLTKPEVFPFFKNPSLPIFVFIGRLTSIKKLEILTQAVNEINADALRVNLLIIGDGTERNKLEKLENKGISENWIHFTGACYDDIEIGKYLFASDLCVSPGNIGLTAIHSLSFGTPVCTHSNLNNQMPEAEAISDGYNGLYFEENNIPDLIEKIEKWLANNKIRELVRQRCFEIIDDLYNPNYQISVFDRLIKNNTPEI